MYIRRALTAAAMIAIAACGGGGSGGSPVAPSVLLTVNPTQVSAGAAATLTWSATAANQCTASGGWQGAVPPTSGSQSTGALSAATDFTLTCTGPGGTAQSSARVAVVMPPPPKPTVTISASPASVLRGSTSVLTWTTTNAGFCSLSGGPLGAPVGGDNRNGSQNTGPLTSTTDFIITCTDALGDPGAGANVRITVIDPPQVSAETITVNVLGVASTTQTGNISAVGPCVAPVTYSILDADQPATGRANVNAATGAFDYTVGFGSDTHTGFKVTLTDTQPCGLAIVDVTLNKDPLLVNQWHIQNNGGNAFSSNLPVFGNDANVAPAWVAGYSGSGIKVGIVDTGLSYGEPDLSLNVDLGHSFNFLDGSNDATPATTVGFDNGTEVAGIVGAVAFNGSGGRGVAFNATLRGYNLLAPGAFSVANMTKSLGGDPISADNDLFVAGFGPAPNALPTATGVYDAIRATSLTLRGGLGATVVSPAGDDFVDWASSPTSGLCADANKFGVSCGDPANDERLGGTAAILVAAIDADGRHSSYSDTGSAVWISAPGGEYGLNANYTTGPNFDPGIVTTTRRGCVYYVSALNPLDSLGAHPLAPDCGYTATMHGTSAAAASVAGVIALMLEANPNLNVRDIKYILAKTARRPEPTFAGVSTTNLIVGSSIVLEQGWTANSAGMTFSNRYGFGSVDASAAVDMAKSYVDYLPVAQTSTRYAVVAAPPANLPAQSVAGRTVLFAVTEPFTRVETVQAFLNLASTPGIHCNQVELTSPSGTKSILLHAASGFSNTDLIDVAFVSNAFYGESVNGSWVLKYFDFCAASATPSTLSNTAPQQLLITGH